MTEPIENFNDFIKKILEILLWVLIFLPMLIFPIILIVENFLPTKISSLMANPDPAMIFALLDSDFFRIAVFPGFTFAASFAALIGLWERKLLAKMQMRVGPLYAGKFEGILQPIADLLKLMSKEIITPRGVDKPIFWAIPLITTAIASALLAVIPLSETSVIARTDVGVLIIFAILGFFPIAALMAGWASNSKYPLIGALRALHQMVAYEIPMILAILGVVILSGSLNLIEIVRVQESVWFLFLLPVGAVVFFITALAELERVPFDLPEAESEIVTGWLTEYSGMLFGVILGIAVYIKFYAFAALFTVFFLGGWIGPSIIPSEIWFILKTFLVITLMIIPRGVFPRIRIDIMLRAGWAKLLMLSLLNIFIALLIIELGILPVR